MPGLAFRPPARDRYNFAMNLLQQLNLPVTENNIRALLAQMLAEEPPGEGAPNNPLNTTLDVGKYGGWSASPNIAKYPNWLVGIQESAKTYQSSDYSQVIRDFKASADPGKTAQDIGLSPWGTSGSLMQQILGGGGDMARHSIVPGSGEASGTIVTEGGVQGAVKDAAGGVTGAIGDALSTVEKFALRGGKILLGVLLIVAAIYFGVVK